LAMGGARSVGQHSRGFPIWRRRGRTHAEMWRRGGEQRQGEPRHQGHERETGATEPLRSKRRQLLFNIIPNFQFSRREGGTTVGQRSLRFPIWRRSMLRRRCSRAGRICRFWGDGAVRGLCGALSWPCARWVTLIHWYVCAVYQTELATPDSKVGEKAGCGV
jgi:hypothetical protein